MAGNIYLYTLAKGAFRKPMVGLRLFSPSPRLRGEGRVRGKSFVLTPTPLAAKRRSPSGRGTKEMKCVICKNGKTKRGKVTVTLERGAMTLVVKGVPARVCDNCGEEYLEEKVMAALELVVKSAAKSGVVVEVRDYAA